VTPLGTVSRLRGTSYGRRFEVTVPATLQGVVTSRLVGTRWDGDDDEPEAAWQLRHRPGAGWQALRDGRPLSGAEGPDGAVERLVADIEYWIAVSARDALFLDAGVVSWRGRVLVVPGHRLPGRTTLVAALVRAGAGYLSDLYAVLDGEGGVRSYPRPLPLGRPPPDRPWGSQGVTDARTGEIPIGDVVHGHATGRPPDAAPLRVGMVARLAYHPGGWRAEDLTRGQATLALIDAAIAGESRLAEVAHAATAAARDAVGLAGTRGDAGLAARRLLDRMDTAFPASARADPGDDAGGGPGSGQGPGPGAGQGSGQGSGPGSGPGSGSGSGQGPAHEARAAPHSSSRIEWTTESRQAPRTKT
jgi:hypothetical protein